MRSFIAAFGLTGILIVGACSSSTEEKPKSQANTVSVVNAQNANAATIANGAEVAGPHTVDANSVNATSSDAMPSQMQQRINQMRKTGDAGPPADPSALAKQNARPAPDNSTFATYLTDAGYEVREFKNNPQLLKAEKKTESNGNSTLKIYLRNGQVVELPGQKVAILGTATAAYILQQAGIAPQQPKQQPNPPGPVPTKKSAVN